jgi:hypothetical protein
MHLGEHHEKENGLAVIPGYARGDMETLTHFQDVGGWRTAKESQSLVHSPRCANESKFLYAIRQRCEQRRAACLGRFVSADEFVERSQLPLHFRMVCDRARMAFGNRKAVRRGVICVNRDRALRGAQSMLERFCTAAGAVEVCSDLRGGRVAPRLELPRNALVNAPQSQRIGGAAEDVRKETV